ncbi:MAG TPA: type II toxin-antitoxin system RelE/ParE family toxin [Chthoniobacterales bacterium]
MSYSVQVTHSAKHELKRLSPDAQKRVLPILLRLKDDPFPSGHKKLKGNKGYRVRIGDYRVLYEVDIPGLSVIVSAIVHRKDAY